MKINYLIEILRSDGSLIINKNLARNIGLYEAILYCELCAKYKYFEEKGWLDDEGYFYNTVENMEKDTTLSKHQQAGAIKKLVELGLILYELRGLPAKRHFKIIDDENLLKKCLEATSRCSKIEQLEVKKLNSNNTNSNNTNTKDPGAPQQKTKKENRKTDFEKDFKNLSDIFSDSCRLTELFFTKIREWNKSFIMPTGDQFSASAYYMQKMLEEGRSPDLIEGIINWLPTQDDSAGFCWRKVILGTKTLHRNLNKLIVSYEDSVKSGAFKTVLQKKEEVEKEKAEAIFLESIVKKIRAEGKILDNDYKRIPPAWQMRFEEEFDYKILSETKDFKKAKTGFWILKEKADKRVVELGRQIIRSELSA